MTGTFKLLLLNRDFSPVRELVSVVIPREGDRIVLPDTRIYRILELRYHFCQEDWIRPTVTVFVEEVK